MKRIKKKKNNQSLGDLMSDTTQLIKELRIKTGAGFLDCKNALDENENDIEQSVEY